MQAQFTSAILVLALIFPTTSSAGGTALEWLDAKDCVRRSVVTDLSDSALFNHDHTIWEGFDPKEWSVYEYAPGAAGLCKFSYDEMLGLAIEFSCTSRTLGKFPLAGATFKRIQNGEDLPEFRCATGCSDGVPQVVSDACYDCDGETDGVSEREMRLTRYRAECESHR